jgi:putative ABC transport system permease protein
MFKNYLTSVWRYVSRNKGFTLINVVGLVIGMAAFMLIGQFVVHELSYDEFWTNKDRAYRMQLDRYNKGELSTRWASGCAGVGPDLQNNFPEVEAYVRMHNSNALFSYQDKVFREDAVHYTSKDFFKVFGYTLLKGVDSTALAAPNAVVMSRSLARKYFGDEEPIGKTIRNNGDAEYTVTGIFEDFPDNSHVKISAMLSFQTYARLLGLKDESEITQWQWDGFMTYILMRPGTDPRAFEAKLQPYVDKHEEEDFKQYNARMMFHLQALTDIHLDSNFIGEFKPNGNRETVSFLMVIAVLIILIAWINYVNLSTAKSIERAREVGVRKVMGGHRRQLIQQFLVESVVFNVIAVLISIGVVIALTPWFGELTGRPLGYSLFKEKYFWIAIISLIIGGAALSGLYPAFVLSSFKPVEVLKGRFKNTSKGVYFRKGMVVVQFVASITLIVGTYVVYQQISFMRKGALAVDMEKTLLLTPPNVTDSTFLEKFELFKNKMLAQPEVTALTASSSVPGASPGWNAGGIRRLSQGEGEANQYRVIMTDGDFIPFYGLEVAAGRGFSDDNPNEGKSVLLNESAARLMSFANIEDAINDQINFWGDTFRIVGVVKNYRQESMKKDFEPLIFRYGKGVGTYSVKFNTSSVGESLKTFEKEWDQFFPGNPFTYKFLDEHYNQQYKADQQFGKSFGLFSGLAIFIACLGLFGLSSLTALQRTKEIGVRKVLGASVPGILGLVSKDYFFLLGIAIGAATPLSWYIMSNWLADFANRISLSPWIFILPSLFVVVVAMLTVSIHTLKAARTNPATSLRYE